MSPGDPWISKGCNFMSCVHWISRGQLSSMTWWEACARMPIAHMTCRYGEEWQGTLPKPVPLAWAWRVSYMCKGNLLAILGCETMPRCHHSHLITNSVIEQGWDGWRYGHFVCQALGDVGKVPSVWRLEHWPSNTSKRRVSVFVRQIEWNGRMFAVWHLVVAGDKAGCPYTMVRSNDLSNNVLLADAHNR